MNVRYARSAWGRVQVNWVRNEMAGITYLEGPVRGGSAVVRVDELTLDEPTPHEGDLRSLSTDELQARLRELRASRRAPTPPPPPVEAPTRKSTPKRDLAALIAGLTPEQARALLESLKKGGDTTT